MITRFAPSPTGRLHIGHAYSALFAYEKAMESNGRFILRIEDIDTGRCRPEFTEGIYEDLRWLGLEWEEPVRLQSRHMDVYKAALDRLDTDGLLYPCFCTRKDIRDEIERAGGAPHGPEGTLYPGTCRTLSAAEKAQNMAKGTPYALRLNMQAALAYINHTSLFFNDYTHGQVKATPEILGDVVLARKDCPTSYHLSVCVDDAVQGITCVTRGEDLFYATHLHRLLQELLSLPVPEYHHHPLLTDEHGQRFAKRNKSVTLEEMRHEGYTAEDLKRDIQMRLSTA
jgi:glutamyl-Q tRNA(Asp) synthetase